MHEINTFSFCGQCGADTTTISRTPAGWGQQPQSAKVCAVNQSHNIAAAVTLEALRTAHNGVITAQAGPSEDKKALAISQLANLMSKAKSDVLQAYCKEINKDKPATPAGSFC
jgi:hypothetical protein